MPWRRRIALKSGVLTLSHLAAWSTPKSLQLFGITLQAAAV